MQGAVDAAGIAGDTISVAPGVYTGPGNRDVEISSKLVSIISRGGSGVTTIDCQHAGRAFYLHHALQGGSVIEGFTITNCLADLYGAVYTFLTSITLRDCVLASNRAWSGGAVYATYDATFEDCVFVGNYADSATGAGAVFALQGTVVLERCVLVGNATWGVGGAVHAMSGVHLAMRHCTISANYAGDLGGGVYSFASNVVLDHTICRDNCARIGDELYVQSSVHTAYIICSDVDLGEVVSDNLVLDRVIDSDARFCNPRPCGESGGDYSLMSDSPCLPDGNPCAELIGALESGCIAPAGDGACCLPDATCVLATLEQCAALQGTFLGSIPCLPNTCQPSPTERITWGRVKARFR